MALDELKSEKVIRLAKQKPFLSIKELAIKCNTTAKYVRTVLSEEGISLLELRKSEYIELREKYNKLLLKN